MKILLLFGQPRQPLPYHKDGHEHEQKQEKPAFQPPRLTLTLTLTPKPNPNPNPQIHLDNPLPPPPRRGQCIRNRKRIDYLLITNITPQVSDEHFAAAEDQTCPFARVCTYDRHLNTVLLRIDASRAQSAAAMGFMVRLGRAVERLGLELHLCGGYHSTQREGGKRPDGAWKPIVIPRGRGGEWPGGVVEVGFAESEDGDGDENQRNSGAGPVSKLMEDVRGWFQASKGDVKVVFTIEISRTRPRIVISQWVLDHIQNETDCGYKREQRVEISKSESGEQAVVSQPVQISFERLFLCPPGESQGETVCIPEADLARLAKGVWMHQGFQEIECF